MVVGARDAHRGREVERAREHREPVEQRLLSIGQELVAPPDRGARASGGDRGRAGACRTGRRGGRRGARVSAPGWTCGPARPRARSRAGCRRGACTAPRHPRRRPRAVRRPPPRRVAHRARPRPIRAPVSSGATTWMCSPASSSGSRLVARTTTSGHTARTRSTSSAAASRTCSQLSRTSSTSPRTQRVGELIERRAARIERDETRARDGRGEAVAVLERREIGEERAARMVRLLPARDLDREPGLAGAPGSGQRDEAVIQQEAAHRRDVVAAADEARALRRDRRRRDIEGARGREVGGEVGPVDLVERDRAVDVAELVCAQ